MGAGGKPARGNQRLRTRKDLLRAAATLVKAGRNPSMEEVAEEALVSRATAYRYFPNIEELMIEAPLDMAVPVPEEVFAGDASADPAERADRAEAVLHDMCYENEAQLRLMLVNCLRPREPGGNNDTTPVRQNRRTPLIEAALAPARRRFSASAYRKLCAALALVFGTESMVVFRDVLPMDDAAARRVKSWAIRALVKAALQESRRPARRRKG